MDVFDHPNITTWWDIAFRIRYTERILKGTPLKYFKAVLRSHKVAMASKAGTKWAPGETKPVPIEYFCKIYKNYSLDYGGDSTTGKENFKDI